MERIQNTRAAGGMLKQNLGLTLMILCLATAGIVGCLGGETMMTENLILLSATAMIALFSSMRLRTGSVILTGTFILIYFVYRIFLYASEGIEIKPACFLWPFLFLGSLFGSRMYVDPLNRLEEINAELNQQVDDLVIIDPVTGLENLHSMYTTLSRYMALSTRNHTEFGLMLIRLRYGKELRKVLSEAEFDAFRRKMGQIVVDVLRIEDRSFAMDGEGSMGVIYFAGEAGAAIVRKRLLEALEKPGTFLRSREDELMAEFAIVYAQYHPDFGKDAIGFTQAVEKEFAYEV